MSYRYLEHLATADIAFEATGTSVEEMFRAAADATMNVMIEELASIRASETKTIDLENGEIDLLLFDLLQELIYYKDAEQLLLRVTAVSIDTHEGLHRLHATAAGERLDPGRHEQRADVKAVTLHQFKVEHADGTWKALVILDV